ncbi:MAG: DUF29 domain-containing protein [bacterium]|nr:DUF29 domain-containing protein [bacterium]
MNWQELSTTSHYQTAVAVRSTLLERDMEEAATGIEELIEALGRSEERALKSQLTRLMMHILKWKIQPLHPSRSWLVTISNARIEIADLLEYEPHLKPKINDLWEKCFKAARQLAKDETGIVPEISKLSWEEVFEKEYSLEGEDERR